MVRIGQERHGPLPDTLLPYAERLFFHFPEVLLSLGSPCLEKCFDLPPSEHGSQTLVEETQDHKLVQVFLVRKRDRCVEWVPQPEPRLCASYLPHFPRGSSCLPYAAYGTLQHGDFPPPGIGNSSFAVFPPAIMTYPQPLQCGSGESAYAQPAQAADLHIEQPSTTRPQIVELQEQPASGASYREQPASGASYREQPASLTATPSNVQPHSAPSRTS